MKVEPQSIGVGQYQHDVNQRELSQRLDEVVRKLREQGRRGREQRERPS